mgnify:CR=1 FL=1
MAVHNCQAIGDEHFEDLEKNGLTREDGWDIGAITAFFALSNRMAFVSAMKPNPEFHLMGRIPKKK